MLYLVTTHKLTLVCEYTFMSKFSLVPRPRGRRETGYEAGANCVEQSVNMIGINSQLTLLQPPIEQEETNVVMLLFSTDKGKITYTLVLGN